MLITNKKHARLPIWHVKQDNRRADKMKLLEIFFDVEAEPEKIGQIKSGLWCVVKWELDDNSEPIIESSKILKERLTKQRAIQYAQCHKDSNTIISGDNANCRFSIKPVWYELLPYTYTIVSNREA